MFKVISCENFDIFLSKLALEILVRSTLLRCHLEDTKYPTTQEKQTYDVKSAAVRCTPIHVTRDISPDQSVNTSVQLYLVIIFISMHMSQSLYIKLFDCHLSSNVQRKALRIILPKASYDQALVRSGLQTLIEHRGQACERFVQALSVPSSLCIACLLSERSSISHGYGHHTGTARQCVTNNRLLRTDRFITFKYG